MTIKSDFIIVPLMIMIFITIISLLTGDNFIATAIEQSNTYRLGVNGSVTEIDLNETETSLSIDPLVSAITWIIVISAIAVASSIAIFGSGLSTEGTKWVAGLTFFTSIWIMFSTYPFPMITGFGVVGGIIYFSLTIFYAIGCIWFLVGGSD